jgi:putative endonuclease
MEKSYYVYIVTNKHKTTLYVGVTRNIEQRVYQHYMGTDEGFTKQYHCKYLVYYESFKYILNAIEREKQIKKYSRKKKEALISKFNPEWHFLNEKFGI